MNPKNKPLSTVTIGSCKKRGKKENYQEIAPRQARAKKAAPKKKKSIKKHRYRIDWSRRRRDQARSVRDTARAVNRCGDGLRATRRNNAAAARGSQNRF